MADIPIPKEYLPHPGEPVLPYKHWIKVFENFIFMKNTVRKLGDEEKNRYLFTLLGFEGVRIFSAHPIADKISTAPHAEFKAAVAGLFQQPVNPFRAYYDLEQRKQGAMESTQDFLTALRSLMGDCDFGGREEHHLAIRLVCGCYNKDTQKKLLARPTIDLDEVIRIMQADETAMQSSAAISNVRSSNVYNVRKHNDHHRQRQHPPRQQRQQLNTPTGQHGHPNNGLICHNCGRHGHRSKDPTCPALQQTCRQCGKLGHFAHVCRSSNTKATTATTARKVRTVSQQVNNVHTFDPFHISIQLETGTSLVSMTAQVDTGAQISGIPLRMYEKHFKHFPLLPPTTLRNFDNSVMSDQSIGRITTNVHYKGRKVTSELHVLPPTCNAVIGQDLIHSLNLCINGTTLQVCAVRDFKQDILNRHPSLLSEEMGTFPDYEHVIDITNDAVPTAQKLRPLPLSRRDKVANEIKVMENLDIWEPVDKSTWVHHMVSVMKPDDNVRVTTDLSPLNSYVVPDRFPLPNPKDLFLELKGAKIFTKLDLRKAFYHIKLAEESRQLTTTITHQGLRQYKRLPMGLKDAASVCQRLVSQTLSDCSGTIAYVDDILVFGSTQKEHDYNLDECLKRLAAKDFRLQLPKCEFSVTSVNFLGHVISANGITPDPRNVKPIIDAPTPRTVKQVQSFLGMVNYYQDFINNLATLAEPLRNLTRKNTRFAWSKTCDESFRTLKQAIAGSVKNFIFDPNAPTFVTTDASDVGLGAVLSQIQNGQEVPILHASHTLQPRERNYAVNEKEALACVWSCETWAKFLLGRHFTLRTDHAALTTLLGSSTDSRKSSKFQRWFQRLSEFDYTLQYRKGSQNYVADALSRLSLPSTQPALHDAEYNVRIRTINADHLTLHSLQQHTKNDCILQKICSYVKNGWPHKKCIDANAMAYHTLRDEITMENGYLIRNDRFIVPSTLRKKLLDNAHEGHPGIVRMKRKVRETYWWPGQDTDVERYVKHCKGCQRSEKSLAPSPVPLTRIPLPDKPWQKLAIDISGPFVIAPLQSKFIVVLMDYYSKFPEILLTPTITSNKVITWLNEIFSRYGAPDEIVSDNGTQFVSSEFCAFLEKYNVGHIRTAVYNPQTNGCVERFNRYLKHGIQAFQDDNISWDTGIQNLMRSYRATPLTADNKSPAELLLGRKMRLPFELQRHSKTNLPNSVEDQQSTPSPTSSSRGPYRVGNRVLARRPQVLKGQSPWTRPLTIVKVLGNWTYQLSDGQIWNARKLRRFLDENIQWNNTTNKKQLPRRSARHNRGVPPPRFPNNY